MVLLFGVDVLLQDLRWELPKSVVQEMNHIDGDALVNLGTEEAIRHNDKPISACR